MATAKQIKSAYESLCGSALDIDKLTQEAYEKHIKNSMPNITKEEAKEMAKQAIKEAKGKLYHEIRAKLFQIAGSILVLPQVAAALIAQFSTIPATVIGTAAAAAGPMVSGVKSQASAVKAQLQTTLSNAAELDIDIPGIDPLLTIPEMLGPLL